MSRCEICKQHNAQYSCLQPRCVKITGNIMYCYKCYLLQHEKHQPYTLEEVRQIAYTNCSKQIELIQLIIQKNSQEQFDLQNFLESQKEIYLQWHNQQKKSIKAFMEKENYQLNIKIQELQQVLQQQNLDLMLNYCVNKVDQYQDQYQKENQQSEIERQFQIQDIQARINFIKELKFSISDLSNIFLNLPQASIPQANEKATIKYKQCAAHDKPQKYLCTHKDCITQNSKFPFYCEICFKVAHTKHDFQTSAKKYKCIKKEQDEKTSLITQEQEKIKLYMQQEFNKNCKLIQQQIKEKMNKYEKIKNNMSTIKDQSIDNLKKQINFIFIENNINVSLLSKTIEGIKQDYSFQCKSFSQKMSIDLQMESREILSFSAEIDQNIENEQNELNILRQELKSKNEEIEKLKSQLNQNQNFISRFSDLQIQFYLLQENQNAIKQKINELTKNLKEKMNTQYFINFERESYKSFDNDFKSIQSQISQTDIIIKNIISVGEQICNIQGKQRQNYFQTNNPQQSPVTNQREENIYVSRVRGTSFIKIQEIQRTNPNQPNQNINNLQVQNQIEQSTIRRKQITITSIQDFSQQGKP